MTLETGQEYQWVAEKRVELQREKNWRVSALGLGTSELGTNRSCKMIQMASTA